MLLMMLPLILTMLLEPRRCQRHRLTSSWSFVLHGMRSAVRRICLKNKISGGMDLLVTTHS